MSGMANEMQRRLEEDGGAGLPPTGGDGVPGNVGAADPSAGTSNTDTPVAGGTPPETIPYARFKEVNDRLAGLRDYEQLREYGYSSDSLMRLAAFEAQYQVDPVGVWKSMADNLDLPQTVKDAIERELSSSSQVGSAEGESSTTPPSTTELPPEVQQRLDYVDQLRAEREQQESADQLDRIVAAWDELDKQDGLETPERTKMTYISVVAGSGRNFTTVEELAKAARESALEYREAILGSAIRRPTGGDSPALPGSLPASSGPIKFKDLREASKAAEADAIAGRLPGMQ